jgi:putative FmdB family regulatory protein
MTAAVIMIGGAAHLRGGGSAIDADTYYPNVMPLFEYQCRRCEHRFELLVRDSTVLECPECHSAELDKQLSVFAVAATSSKLPARAATPGPCGACGDPRGPGACAN